MSGLDGREMGWDERMTGVQGERDSIVLGAIELGGGGNLNKIDQFTKLYYFSADVQKEINLNAICRP